MAELKLIDGSIGELIAYPPAVEPRRNDWYERDGAETAGEPMELAEKMVRIAFAQMPNRGAFLSETLANGVWEGYLSPIPWKLKLRLQRSVVSEQIRGDLHITCYDLSEVAPSEPVAVVPTGLERNTRHSVDGVPFSDFGAKVLRVAKAPEEVKEAPIGAKRLTRGAYRVSVAVLMQAHTMDAFAQNRTALLYHLLRSDDLGVVLEGESHRAYYVSGKTLDYDFHNGTPWWMLELVLMIIK